MKKNMSTKKNKPSLRRCVGCREMHDKRGLIRIVRFEDSIDVDLSGKAKGRGAYLCKSIDCYKRAFKQKAVDKSFKARAQEGVYVQLEDIVTSFAEGGQAIGD